MTLRLPVKKKPGAALRAVLLSLAKRAQRDLEQLESDPEEHIHSLRTGMKKYRSLLRLAHSSLGGRLRGSVLERVGVLKDGLAGSRDDAVIFKTASTVLGDEATRRLGLSCPHAEGETCAPENLLDAARELAVLTDSMDFDDIDGDELRDRWKHTMKKCKRAREKARESDDPHDFHSWRKRVKDLWYQSEALAGRPKKIASESKPAKKLSDMLGLEHDLTLVLDSVKVLTEEDREILNEKRAELRLAALAHKLPGC